MGIFRKITNLVTTVATGGRNTAMIMEDGSHAMRLVKERILRSLKRFFNRILLYFGLLSLVIIFIVVVTSLVFEIFSVSFYGDDRATTELNIEDIKEWSDSLTKEDIEQMQAYGSNIHPSKIYEYALVEDESYPQNVNIKVPMHVKKWGDSGDDNYTIYLDYNYKIRDSSYPYRQWWQSTASLDVAYGSSDDEKDMRMIKNAKKELKPIFDWADPKTNSYKNGDTYRRTSDKEEILTTLTTVKVIKSGEDGGTTINYTEEITYRPKPFLNKAIIMFGDVSFEFKEFSEKLPPIKTVKNVGEKTTIITTMEREITGWELVGNSIDYQEAFLKFLDSNKIDTVSDPYMMSLIVDNMPNSYDYNEIYAEYLEYMELYGDSYQFGGGPTGTYTGDFGSFEGGTFGWPVPSHQHITSHYGYRTHPVTKKPLSFHTGVDLRAPMGVDIVATADGIVSYVGARGGYGNTVMINHGSGIESLYAHNSRLAVAPGQKVSRGDVIAKAGSTGRSTGPHLHFEIRKNGKYVEPLSWLKR